MADFQKAFRYMMADEDPSLSGVVTPDPIENPSNPDPCALARFGLNSHWHPELAAEGYFDPQRVPTDQALQMAEDTYKYAYWCPIHGYQVIWQDIANKYFDLAVNEGCSEATKIMQRACNQVLNTVVLGYLPLMIDGICGPQTYDAINRSNPEDLMPALKYYAMQFYRDVAYREKWPDRKLAAMLGRVARS